MIECLECSRADGTHRDDCPARPDRLPPPSPSAAPVAELRYCPKHNWAALSTETDPEPCCTECGGWSRGMTLAERDELRRRVEELTQRLGQAVRFVDACKLSGDISEDLLFMAQSLRGQLTSATVLGYEPFPVASPATQAAPEEQPRGIDLKTYLMAEAEGEEPDPWADNPSVCAECHHSNTSHSKGPCVECDCIVFMPPKPQLPGGYGPTEALRKEIVEALRELELETYVPPVFNAFARVLADRLERKP